jgi:ubiquinone/menaquinone biosynthesis C-methylase UbiE
MNRVEFLKTEFHRIEKITNDEWMKSLDDRKKKELEFHDLHRDTHNVASLNKDSYEKFYGNKKYYAGTRLSRDYVQAWINKHARGNIFLDYACGNGGLAIRAAKAGAELAVGIDISPISVNNAKAEAQKEGVQDNTYFLQADAENTKLPDGSVDAVICSGMLHHLDLSYAFPELRRILKPHGRLLAMEALEYNPAIKLYRHYTPMMRTEWEKAHILGLSDIRFAQKFFTVGEIRYWHITSILTPFYPSLLPLWNRIDSFLTKIPIIRLLAWMFTFELIKPGTASSESG